MRNFLASAAIAAATVSTAAAQSAVDAITFTDMTNSGSYSAVSSYTNGQCSTEDQSFNGAFSPMNEEVTIVIRGPIKLLQAAVYSGSGSSSKHKRSGHGHNHARGHREFHKRNKAIREVQEREEKRGVGDEVVATINGQVVSWANEYDGGAVAAATSAVSDAAPAPAAATTSAAAAPIASSAAAPIAASSAVSSSAPEASTSSGSSSGSYSSGSWTRVAYYNSQSATASGLKFLANPSYSAVLTVLSAATDVLKSLITGTDDILGDVVVPSDTEFTIWTDTECNGDCPYTLDNSLAYHGFDTSKNIGFFFEFQMPTDNSGSENSNLPAIWLLNSRIPRVGQYSDCTCWKADSTGASGCGEIDLWEANPTNGPDMLLPMFHCMGTKAGGSQNSDYFERPYDGSLTTGAVFCHDTQSLQMASINSTDLSALDGSVIDSICNQNANAVSFSSLA